MNDNVPVFEQRQYVVNVSEAAPVGTAILTLSAADADSDSNAHLSFRAEPHTAAPGDVNLFHVDAERGLVLLRQKLDREQAARLRFVVFVSDAGVPSLSSSAIVTVTVGDVNDNSPTFDRAAYEVTVSDRAPHGQFVTAVQAFDDDVTDRGRLTYAIVDGNIRQAFMIDSQTGVIRTANVAQRLAVSVESAYVLNVSATDGVYSTFSQVKVIVRHCNSFTPVFSHSVFDAELTEHQPAGTVVTTASATDRDKGVYGDVTYSIVGEEADEVFAIDSQTGEMACLHCSISFTLSK